MRITRKLRLRLRSLFQRSQVERDLEDEMRDYLAREQEQGRGAPWGIEQAKEACRDARGVGWLEDALMDARFAVRALGRAPVFTLAAVAALALCIGANTAILTVVDAILFRPLPFPESERLVFATEGIPTLGYPSIPYSCPDYLFLRAHSRSFESVSSYSNVTYELSGAGEPRRIVGARVTASLFEVLQTAPAWGRAFSSAEDESARPVAVLSEGLARSLFGSPERALSATVHLNRKPYQVIGVMGASFSFPFRGLRFDGTPARIFVPMSFSPAEREAVGDFNFSTLARLKPAVSLAQAATETQALLTSIVDSYPPEVRRFLQQHAPGFRLQGDVTAYRREVTGSVERPLWLLLAGAVLVLLVGCADVANLVFSRLASRRWEFAVRSALGAGRFRLVRQTLTEGLLLSALGAVSGVLAAYWALPALVRSIPASLPRQEEIALDWRILAYIAAVVLATPLLFCIALLFEVLRPPLVERLREGGRTTSRSRGQRLLMSGAVVAQFGLVFALLAASSLLLRSFSKASASNPGFRPRQVLSMHVALPAAEYAKPAARAAFFDRLLEAVSRLPGVEQSGATSALPMRSSGNNVITTEGGLHATERSETLYASGDALATLGLTLVEGRLLGPSDRSSPQQAAVITESLARRAWPGRSAVGRRIKFGVDPAEPWMTVAGVVKDVRSGLSDSAPRLLIFVATTIASRAAGPPAEMTLLVRTPLAPAPMLAALRGEVRRLDPSLPVDQAQALEGSLEQSLEPERFRTALLASFAATALLLALLGIAGLLAYATSQREREFGVRIAFGAQRGQLLGMLLAQALRLSAAGIALGLAASLALGSAVKPLLYEVQPYDPVTLVSLPLLLALLTVLATLWPAWRASRTDALIALRGE